MAGHINSANKRSIWQKKAQDETAVKSHITPTTSDTVRKQNIS